MKCTTQEFLCLPLKKKKDKKNLNPLTPAAFICKREPFLTSSDPVSDGLAFFGAITGESDPSKSSCKK